MSEDLLLGADGKKTPSSKVGERVSPRPRKGDGQGKGDQQEGSKLNAIPGTIRLLRTRMGLTQAQAEEETHVSSRKISAWENGQHPNEDDLRHYIEALGSSVEDFARLQIEYLSGVHNFKNEWELDLDMESYYKRHVAEVRRLLARNRKHVDVSTYNLYVHRLRKCEEGGADLVHELRLLKEAIESFQYVKVSKKSRP